MLTYVHSDDYSYVHNLQIKLLNQQIKLTRCEETPILAMHAVMKVNWINYEWSCIWAQLDNSISNSLLIFQ